MESTNQQDTKIAQFRNDPRLVQMPFRKLERGAMAIIAIVLTGLLVTAAILTPNPAGSGTHQQLGLPPCTMKFLFGIPCPACGMTTSWALVLKGHPLQAMNANAGGVLLAIISLVSAITLLRYAYRGTSSASPWFTQFLVWSLSGALAVATAQWLFRL
jgi:hypothetical protein